MTEIYGYLAAVFVGLVLGMIGAGGSILTVPIMVYLMGINPVLATVYSLFVVGSTTLIGSVSYIRQGLVNIKTSVAFALPSLISIFITRKYILPSLPEVIFQSGDFVLSKDIFILLLFAVIMLLSSLLMIFSNVKEKDDQHSMSAKETAILIFYGIAVGFITGMVGAGGGFLIVPALVFFARIPVKAAIGTSLLIIAANSLSGFAGDLTGNYVIDWKLLLIFLGFAVAGILIGSRLAKFVSGKNLKKAFGAVVLLMGFYIIFRELKQLNIF
ncbi:MAG: sulfite exporter TauE/SafE family protein [Bacteroidetes bacterium]|nr:sulfite exporter TauE/SafE family protein [Bacteroidota bacterium]